MDRLLNITAAGFILLSISLTACSSLQPAPNPTFDSTRPPSELNAVTIPNPAALAWLSNFSSKVSAAEKISDPLNPWSAITDPVISAGLGLTALVLGYVARKKSVEVNRHAEAMSALAAGVVAAGPEAVSKTLDSVSTSPHYALVAEKINNATP